MPGNLSKRGHNSKDVGVDTKSQHKIAFVRDSLRSSVDIEVVRLRNPHTDVDSMYIIDKDKKTLHEIMAFDQGSRCWFIGETVESLGKLHLISQMDVTYIILPYLMKAQRIVPMDHLLEDEEFPDISSLDEMVTDKDFSNIADRKGNPELNAWKYNEEKTLEWLSGRVSRLSTLLHEKKVPTSTAQSLTYVDAMKSEEAKEAYNLLALGIISEYLPEEIATKLHKYLKLPEKKKITNVLGATASKRPRMEGPTEDYTKDNVAAIKGKTSMTAKEKALAKSAAGSKSILSFFGKK